VAAGLTKRRTPSNAAKTAGTAGDQMSLPLGKPPAAGSARTLTVARRAITVHFVRHRRARRYILRVLPDGAVRLTVPGFGTRAEALAFLRRQLRWVDLQRYTAARNAASVLFRGELLMLRTEGIPARDVSFGTESTRIRDGESARQAAVRHLKSLAARELPERLRALAGRLGFRVKRVTVRGQQTRWGSCSASGAIALNWRLIQMPDSVGDYLLIHELMHLRVRSHGRRFWALVEHACPDHRHARRWLKAHESELA